MSATAYPAAMLCESVRERHFVSVFGVGRGAKPPAEGLLRAGGVGERELGRLCALVDAGDLTTPLQTLRLCADELAPELERPQAEVGDISENAWWRLWSDMWAISRRIADRPCNRAERLLGHYVRANPAARLPGSRKTAAAVSAFRYFGAVPHRLAPKTGRQALAEALVVQTLRATLHTVLIDEAAGAYYEPTVNSEFEAWGAVMAEWTVADTPKAVLPHVLGAEGAAELFDYLEGLGVHGWSAQQWLSERYLPFANWQFFYSDVLLHAALVPPAFRGGVEIWGPGAREHLQESLLTMPDCIYG